MMRHPRKYTEQQQTDNRVGSDEKDLKSLSLSQYVPGIRNGTDIELVDERREIPAQKVAVIQKIAECGIGFTGQEPDVVCLCP